MNQKTLINIIIFVIVALAGGWLGLLVDRFLEPEAEGDSLGMGIWLVFPLLTSILLRAFAGDGWKDIGFRPNLKGNLKWYFISIITFPTITLFVLIIGKITGWISFSNFNASIFIFGFATVLAVNFVKNIFEEFVWRGYLTTKLLKLKTKDIWLYAIVGGVWGLWHLPYYLFFLPETDILQVLPVSKMTFAFIAVVTMMAWGVMFIELYRLTKSIWSVVLLHTIEDSLINHLISNGHIIIASGKEILTSPIVGIITTAFYLIVGLYLRANRIKKENSSCLLFTTKTQVETSLEGSDYEDKLECD